MYYKKIKNIALFFLLYLLPEASLAEINNLYDAKREAVELYESIVNSPIYGMLYSSLMIVGIFVTVIVAVMVLIMILKR